MAFPDQVRFGGDCLHILTPAEQRNANRTRLILLVEDEELIRMLLADELRDQSYLVVEAADGDEAVAFIGRNLPIDLVVSDVRMPGSIDGLGLLDHIRRCRPGLPVIIASGHVAEYEAAERGAAACLVKPYSIDVALRTIAAHLPVN